MQSEIIGPLLPGCPILAFLIRARNLIRASVKPNYALRERRIAICTTCMHTERRRAEERERRDRGTTAAAAAAAAAALISSEHCTLRSRPSLEKEPMYRIG